MQRWPGRRGEQGRKLEDYCNKKLSAEFITANKFGSGPVAAARRLMCAQLAAPAAGYQKRVEVFAAPRRYSRIVSGCL